MMVSVWRTVLLILAACLVVAESAYGGGYFPQKVHRTEYTSPSGRLRLVVDPTQPYGEGPAQYRLRKGGRDVWSGQRPFTLVQAAVADDGTVGGYAYTSGPARTDKAHFLVAIIDPAGKVRLQERTLRTGSVFIHAPANPLGIGLMLDPPNDRLIVRVADPDLNRGEESWRVYRLSTARKVNEFAPKAKLREAKAIRFVIDARPVPGTSLVLAHWWRYETFKQRGAVFTLIDPNGETVWRYDLPDDYEVPGDTAASDQLMNEIRGRGAILSTASELRFSLRFVRVRQEVAFAIAPGPKQSWTVTEVGRKPYAVGTPSKPEVARVSALALKSRGVVTLRSPAHPLPEVRNVQVFCTADRGRFCVIRQGPADPPAFLLVEPSGRTRALAIPGFTVARSAEWRGCARLADSRFIGVYSSTSSRARGWVADFNRGTVTELASPLPPTNAMTFLPSGGFALLGWSRYDTKVASLSAYDIRFKLVWKIDHTVKHEWLARADNLTVTRDGLIGAFEPMNKRFGLFDQQGNFVRFQRLSGGSESWLFSEVAALPNGAFVRVSSDSLVRYSAAGERLGSADLRHSAGWEPQVKGIQVASDGRWWTTDHNALLELLPSGRIGRAIGDAPDVRRLSAPAILDVGPGHRFYAVDGRTHAIHVFDQRGTPARVILTRPEDRLSYLGPHVSVDPRGNVYLGTLDEEDILATPGRYLKYSAKGQRMGIVAYKQAPGSTWLHAPNCNRLWVVDNDSVTLLDENRRPIRSHKRTPDGAWFVHIEAVAVGPDGGLAVLEGGLAFEPSDTRKAQISLFSPSGLPQRVINVPLSAGGIGELALGQAHIVAVADSAGFVMDRSGRNLRQFKLPKSSGPSTAAWKPFLQRSDSELLLYDGDRAVHRFEFVPQTGRR